MITLTDADRVIINGLQGGFPVSERPFAEAGARLGLSETELIARIGALVEAGAISRFGPLWNSEELGGAVCLAAMSVPSERFDEVTAKVNAHAEIAHNYERDHALNMWFVLSSLDPARIRATARAIEEETGLKVWLMPKEEEFFVGFRVEV
ncbi:MAG TPA: Lrp/AsnC family transcriptional regulator [Beijerinckiaceae bacterium]|nr:Lrp/AsnC family transcriptional regulator [Beijerinckiaceae bacterium]